MFNTNAHHLLEPIPFWLFWIAEDIVRDSFDGRTFHGFQKQCGGNKRPVTLVVMDNCFHATRLKDRLDSLGSLTQNGRILSTICIHDLSHAYPHLGIQPVLVTERFPMFTFLTWLQRHQPSPETLKAFFRSLNSTISKIHESGNFIGDLLAYLRVEENEPVIVLPHLRSNLEIPIDAGILNDITSAKGMVYDAFVKTKNGVPGIEDVDAMSFITLCDLAPRYSQQNLMDFSYLIFHSPLVWEIDNHDMYHFIMALHMYSETDATVFRSIVADLGGQRCIDLDWQASFDKPYASLSPEAAVLMGDIHAYNAYRRARVKHRYDYSASLIYVLRCVLQHAKGPHVISNLVREIYVEFPSAARLLYEMLAFRLFGHDVNPTIGIRNMPEPAVQFIRGSAHRFRF